MKLKDKRLEAIKLIISSKELGSQDEVLQELRREGFQLTQATLSRDLKHLVDAGWLRMAAGDDARSKRVQVTAAGKRRMARALPLWREAQAGMQALLGGAPALAALHAGVDAATSRVEASP